MTMSERLGDRGRVARTADDPGISVVIPILNERDSLVVLLGEVDAACAELGCDWEILCVDDGSTDGSVELVRNLARERDNLRLIKLRRHFGKSYALRAGFDQSRGALVVTMDGDGQDDPAEIPALVAKLSEGYDVVSGWKQNRKDPWFKRWGSRRFNKLSARLSGVPLHDVNCGLKVYRRAAVRNLELYGEQHRFIPVLLYQQGWRVTELPVQHRPRLHGRSRFGRARYIRGLLDLVGVTLIGRYQYRPLHLFGGAGLLSFFVGVVICVYLTVDKIAGHAIGTRPLLYLGILLITVGVQLFTIGLLAEMITATRQDVRGSRAVDRIIEPPAEAGERFVPAELESLSRERVDSGTFRVRD